MKCCLSRLEEGVRPVLWPGNPCTGKEPRHWANGGILMQRERPVR